MQIPDNEKQRADFVNDVITAHKCSDIYKEAVIAEQYLKHKNVTITNYQKFLYTVTGGQIPDIWSANFKMGCRHFYRFITQENQFLLGNGVTWNNPDTAEKLGTETKPFDNQLQKAGKMALWGGVAFGFFNLDHVDVFAVTEYAPLYDEEDGAMKAGVRFWQVATDKPLRAILYELDGYTEYMFIKSSKITPSEDWEKLTDSIYYKKKRSYREISEGTEIDGSQIYDGENYPTFPIIPLWGNPEHQSELIGLREQIDAYDLIKSQFADNESEASYILYTLGNASGMDDIDLAQFVEKLRTLHAATVPDEVDVQSHSLSVPHESREALLDRIDKDLYRDAMALDTSNIAGGAVTATEIEAAYDPLNSKCDEYEYCVLDFIQGILAVAGIQDSARFTRSMIVNTSEMITNIVQASGSLPEDYVVEKLMTVLGDADKVNEVIEQIHADLLPTIEE